MRLCRLNHSIIHVKTLDLRLEKSSKVGGLKINQKWEIWEIWGPNAGKGAGLRDQHDHHNASQHAKNMTKEIGQSRTVNCTLKSQKPRHSVRIVSAFSLS